MFGRLEPDPTAARRAAGERVTSASRVVVTRSDSATLAAMTRWHGPGPVTTRMTPSHGRFRPAGGRAPSQGAATAPGPARASLTELGMPPGPALRVTGPAPGPAGRRCPGTRGRCRTLAGPGRRAALWRDRLRRRVAESDPARGTGPGHPGCWVTVTPARARLAPSHGDQTEHSHGD